MFDRFANFRRLFVGVLGVAGLVCVGGLSSAQVPSVDPRLSCAYFSPDPNDTDGPPISYYADLSADEESAVTHSPGVARVDFVLDRKTLELTYKLTYSDLTSAATGVHIHGPQTAGNEAAILIDMAPDGVTNPLEGSTTLNDGLLVYLVQDRMYVNLHTEEYPAGELRGTIRRALPDCSS